MPNYDSFEWEGFNVKAEPLGVRRFRLLRWLPYFVGSSPVFRVTIETTSGDPVALRSELHVYEPEPGPDENPTVLSYPEDPIEKVDQTVNLPQVAASGYHTVEITLESGSSYSYELVTFDAIAKKMLIIGLLAALIGASAGIIIVSLVL